MKSPAVPANEARRLAVIDSYELLATEPDPALDLFAELAADALEVPVALVSLVGADRQWVKSSRGTHPASVPRELAFCAHVVGDGAPLLVEDARADPRFADHPLCVGPPHVRFYAGFPLRTAAGLDLGALSAIDHRPRAPTPRQLATLATLARLVVLRLDSVHRRQLVEHVVSAVPGMLAYWDKTQTCRFANAAYETWFGVAPNDLLGKTMADLLGPIYARNRPFIEGALAGVAQEFEREIPDPAGGPPRASQAHYVPHVKGDRVVGFSVMVTDISRRKHLEAELARRLDERGVLLREIHHRVKNNLQLVASMINMQARQLAEQSSIDALRACQSRVLAIALLHERLYQTEDFARVPLAAYVPNLVTAILDTLGVAQRPEIRLAIGDVALAIDQAIPCGLLVNELVTNAAKHAFPDGRTGTLAIDARRTGTGALRLEIADDGIGLSRPAASPPQTLGMQLVHALARQLQGTVEVVADRGTTVRVTFPLGPA